MSSTPSRTDHPLLSALVPLMDALGCRIIGAADREPGDVPIIVDDEIVAVVRLPALHGALDRLLESVEREMGIRLSGMNREQKQRAIRLLDDRGAFTLRRAVEDVADAMGVSRITVYNYLNAIHR